MIPGQGTRSHMLQLKIPSVATQTPGRQINKCFRKEETDTHFGNQVIEPPCLESLSSFGVVLWGLLGKGEVLRSGWEKERETMMEIRGV